MANSDAVHVMKKAKAVLLLDHQGSYADALDRAEALARDHEGSAIAHRLLGDLHSAAAICALNYSGAASSEVEAHLRSARDALSQVKLLVPDCVDTAAALADVLAESSMYREAEAEYRRALDISLPADPAAHNAAYGPEYPATVNERVREARDKARRSYRRLTDLMIAVGVQGVLDICRRDGPLKALQHARSVAQRFPGSARALLLEAYIDLEYIRGLPPAMDRRKLLGRPLTVANRAAMACPNSIVLSSFRAKLLFILGRLHDAETECRRALALPDPHDPDEDCVPPGSVSGENHGARLISLSGKLHEIVLNIMGAAGDYWEKYMPAERRRDFARVRLDALQEEHAKVDPSPEFSVPGAQSFFKEHESWRFWACPVCDGKKKKKYVETGSLLEHMCSKHPRSVLPRLQSIVADPELKPADDSDDPLDGISFDGDSENHYDTICFEERDDMFKWLFSAPNSGVRPTPFAHVRERKCNAGTMLLEHIKKKLATLPADKSTAQYAQVLSEIQELWLRFVKDTALDYREIMLTLARTVLWREFKKRMTEDPKIAAKKVTADDIEATFANSSAAEDETNEEDASHSLDISTNC